MIVSKPKSTALTALGIFIVICIGIGWYALRAIINEAGMWYHYITAITTLLVAFVLLLRQVLSYKIIFVGDNMVRVKYTFRKKTKQFMLKDLIHWNETVIKTKNAPFKQLELAFDGFLLKLSVQENTNYEKIKKYLKKRVGKKESI